jgi:hypothetical protein
VQLDRRTCCSTRPLNEVAGSDVADPKTGNSGTLADAASLIALANESDAAAAATELNYDDLWLYSLADQKWCIYGTACDALGLVRSD